MARLLKWVIRITGAALLLGLIAVGVFYMLLSRSLPDYDKSLAVSGLTAPVEIVRDNANVPHVFAASDRDAYFGLGYAHAQDRLWQMTTLRRTAQGRLSEVFGTRTLNIDKLLRRLDLYGAARASVEMQDSETLIALDAYAAGVNARLEEINSDALGRGAPEMFLFNAPISPWQPADSIAILKLMALQLSGHLAHEVRRTRVSLMLNDKDRLRDILPDDPGQGIAALPEYASLFPPQSMPRYAETTRRPRDPLSPFAPPELAGASNAWAAARSRQATAPATRPICEPVPRTRGPPISPSGPDASGRGRRQGCDASHPHPGNRRALGSR